MPPDSAPACSTPPAPPPTSTSWRCWPASPAPRAVSTRRTSARKWTRSWIRSTRLSRPPGAASVALVVSHHKCAGPRNWGRTVRNAGPHRRRAPGPVDRAGLLSVHRRLDGAAQRNGRRHHRHPHHLVDAAPGNGGAHARQHRPRMGLQPGGSVRASAARRRLLLPDARGRCAARPAVSGDHDRLRRPAARPASASASVGDVSPRARALQPRPRLVSAGSRGPQDDGPVGAPVPASRAAARSASAPTPTSSCSMRRRSAIPRRSSCRRRRRSASIACW